MAIAKFEDIEAWKAARELTKSVYKITSDNLFSKDYGLRNQIQRTAVSIMDNVAEGFDSQSNKSFLQFLGYALLPATEIRSHFALPSIKDMLGRRISKTCANRRAERKVSSMDSCATFAVLNVELRT